MSDVRIIALGGAGEIGKNCTVIEQGDDIVVVDCGLSFPNEEMLGVDIVIPDFTYLVQNKDRVRGVFLTHAHEDHVGGLPWLLQQMRVPIYGSELTLLMVRNKLEERHNMRDVDLREFRFGEIVEAGSMSVEPIRVTHSIPESGAMAVRTGHGIVLVTGDFRFDFSPVDGKLSNIGRLGELGKEGVVALLSDTTNVERPGWGPSESEVSEGLRQVFSEAAGRVLLTTFSSNIHRMQQVYSVAAETGRKVAVVGRRMETVVDICSRFGYLQIDRGVRIRLDEMNKFPDSQIAILTTGSQGEPMSALVQMSKGEYGRLQIRPGDTVIYSARPIPGNEAAIWRTVNRLFRLGAEVVYEHYPSPVHVSGHAYQEELKMMINLTRPYYVVPVHGEPRHQRLYAKIAKKMGWPDHRIFVLEDGLPLVIEETQARFGEKVPSGRVLVDFGGTPGVTDEVLRDRSNLSRDGIVTVTVAIDPEAGDFVGDPIIQAKGFHDPGGVLESATEVLADGLAGIDPAEFRDVDKIRHQTGDLVRRYIQKRTQLRPLVLPTVVEV
ncbi:MAG: ribonuclease J [Fimbriimonadaceae bacterium]